MRVYPNAGEVFRGQAAVNALIEVNITRDPKKHGVEPQALMSQLEQLLSENLPSLHLRGLMAMGPYPADETQMRSAFAEDPIETLYRHVYVSPFYEDDQRLSRLGKGIGRYCLRRDGLSFRLEHQFGDQGVGRTRDSQPECRTETDSP